MEKRVRFTNPMDLMSTMDRETNLPHLELMNNLTVDDSWDTYPFGICRFMVPPIRMPQAGKAGRSNVTHRVGLEVFPWVEDVRSVFEGAGIQVLYRKSLRDIPLPAALAEVAFMDLFSKNDVAPQLYGALLERTDPYHCRLHVIMQAYDGDLRDLQGEHPNSRTLKALETQTLRQLRTMASLGIICVDLKPENIVYRRTSDGSGPIEVRQIDFQTDFCTMRTFLTEKNIQDIYSNARIMCLNQGHGTVDTQACMAVTVKELARKMNEDTEERLKKWGEQGADHEAVRLGFMVLILAAYSHTLGWSFMREPLWTLLGGRDVPVTGINGVPFAAYDAWLAMNIYNVATILASYVPDRTTIRDILGYVLEAHVI
jgi:hypothetical protein